MHVEYTHQQVMHELPKNSYTTIQSFGGQLDFFNKYIFLFNKGMLNWSKLTVKTFVLQNISILNKCCYFLLSNQQVTLKKMDKGFHKNIVFNCDNGKICCLRTKPAYQNDSWRIMWHWTLTNLTNPTFLNGSVHTQKHNSPIIYSVQFNSHLFV